MRRLPALAAALLAPAVLAPSVARAQATPARPAPARATPAQPALTDTAAARAAVLATVKGLFDALRAGDSAGVRAAFHPSAQLMTTLVRDGTSEVRVDTLANFVRAVGTPHADVWDERLRDTIVHVDGPLATMWTGYGFFAGPRFSHCGVNALLLGRTAAGWRILSIADTRRRTGCPEQQGATPAGAARP